MLHFMWKRIQEIIDKIVSHISIWQILTGGSVSFGLLSAWLSSGVSWINQFGWYGWFTAGLVGALLFALLLLAGVWIRYGWTKTRVMRVWGMQVDAINPLAHEFHTKRIKALDLSNPINRLVVGKRLIDCELVGPANLFFHKNIELNGVGFKGCDIIVLRPVDAVPVYNVVAFEDFQMIGGSIWLCTILIPPTMVDLFAQMGSTFITLTGNPQIDKQPPKSDSSLGQS